MSRSEAQLADRRPAALTAERIMTPAPASLDERCTVGGALQFLVKERHQGAPVVDSHGRWVGAITRSGLITWLLALATRDGGDGTSRSLLAASIEPAIDRSPLRCSKASTLEDVSRVLAASQAMQVLVVEEDEVVGVVSLRDIVRALAFADEPTTLMVGDGQRGHCFEKDGLPESAPRHVGALCTEPVR